MTFDSCLSIEVWLADLLSFSLLGLDNFMVAHGVYKLASVVHLIKQIFCSTVTCFGKCDG